jgi:hypothetical protein
MPKYKRVTPGAKTDRGYELVVYTNGEKEWRLDGLRHRKNGPAFIAPNGKKEWWLGGERHREDGPAVIWSNGHREWYLDDKLHREDGPAVISPDHGRGWYVKGRFLDKHDFETIEMVKHFQAYRLFTPKELAQMKLDKNP